MTEGVSFARRNLVPTEESAERASSPRRPTRLQAAQKSATIGKLLDAALEAFGDRGYTLTTVDDIVNRAGVSRMAFYRHFDSKRSVALALQNRHSPLVRAEYAKLACHADPDETTIAAWIREMLVYVRRDGRFMRVFTEVVAVEPDFWQLWREGHVTVMQLLGERIPAFRKAGSPLPEDAGARLRGHLLLISFEAFWGEVGLRDYPIAEDEAIRVMAHQFRQFIADVPAAA